MPCASTRPSQFLASTKARLATQELRPGGWSDVGASRGSRVTVDGFGLRSAEHQWKSLEVTGFDRRVY